MRDLTRPNLRAFTTVSVLVVLTVATVAALYPAGRYRDGRGRFGREGPSSSTTASYALFEFAPADGTGMGTACACTTPTGAKGEVLTFTRASTAWCTKGNETSGIVNGDLVECASGQPRVMPGGAGTGALGLGVWADKINNTLRSQEINNGAWSTSSAGVAGPTITANAAVAPDGTTTAERIQIPATTAGQHSQVYQVAGCSIAGSALNSAGAYVKGVSGSGTVKLNIDTFRADCSYVAATWTWCKNENRTSVGDTVSFGNYDAMSAQDFYIWQVDCQPGKILGPPITTVGTAATRVAERAELPRPSGVSTAGSAATSVVWPYTGPSNNQPATIHTNASYLGYWYNVSTGIALYDGTNNPTGTYTAPAANTTTRVATWWASSLWQASFSNGTNTGLIASGPYNGNAFAAGTTFFLGTIGGTASHINGVIKQVCIDADSARCR